MAFRLRGIGMRIALLGIIPALAATLLTGAAGIHIVTQLREQETHAGLDAAVRRTEQALAAAQQRMFVYATALAQQAALRGWVARGETPLVRDRLVDTFRQMQRSDPMVAVLEITDRQGRIQARGHNPGRAGDDKSGMVDVARALRGEPAVGISVSITSGQLSFGATIPLLENSAVVGTLRIAGQFDGSTAASIGAQAGGHILLFAGERLGASTLPGLEAAPLLPLLADDSPARSPAGVATRLGGASYLVRALPMPDLDGRSHGVVLLALPLENWLAAQSSAIGPVVLVGMLVCLASLGAGLLGAARMSRPMRGLAAAMREMSGGRLDVVIPGAGRGDEIGAMAGALASFRENLTEARRQEAAAEMARLKRERRAAAVEGYTNDFGQSIAGVMGQLEAASQGMKRAAQRMSGAVGQTRGRASRTASEAADASESLIAVAAGVEEMASSVGEISRQVARAAEVAAEAVREAAAVDVRMRAVTGTADRIGDILGVISDVAGRTNLLALNATIEAARAGEAGKGFAVVASEVKQLAAQTARATEDVAAQIDAMRAATNDAAAAMGGMSGTIARIDEVAATIAAAVEQQRASTREITQRLQGVAVSTDGVSQAMREVLNLAEESGEVSGRVEDASAGIGEQAKTLRAEVESFLHNLRDDVQEPRVYQRRPVQGHAATLSLDGQSLELPLLDISAGGVGLRFAGRAVPSGTRVVVGLAGAPSLDGRIVRCHGGVMGVVFGPGHQDAVDAAVERLCAVAA